MSDGVAGRLVSAGDVAAASGGQVSAGDPRLGVLIDAAQDALAVWLGWWPAGVRVETVTVDGSGSSSLQVPSGRVLDVEEVVVDGRALGEGEFDWSADGMLRLRRGVFPDRFRCVQVTMRHGYEQVPALAGVITRSVLAACASPMGATSESAGQVAVRWGRAGVMLTSEDRAELAPYRLQHWT